MENEAIIKLIELNEKMFNNLTVFFIFATGIIAYEFYLLAKSKEENKE